jgi:ATP-binding cassette subfamily B protein
MQKGEFTIVGARQYKRSSPMHWIMSHIWSYKLYVIGFVVGTIISNVLNSLIPLIIGSVFNDVLKVSRLEALLLPTVLILLGMVLIRGVTGLFATYAIEFIAEYVERNVRDELYQSLLSKSQSFYNRQRVGDVMALATNDIRQINMLVNPGINLIFDALMNLLVPLSVIGFLNVQLLLVPLLFVIAFIISLLDFSRRIGPSFGQMRQQFGVMNSTLTETINGIETVQSAAQEKQEFAKFAVQARKYRNLYVQNGKLQGSYLPLLLLALALAGSFLHGMILYTHGELSLGNFVAFLSLVILLSYTASVSLSSFVQIHLGLAGAGRILKLMNDDTAIDENRDGYSAPIQGEVVFEQVFFSYGSSRTLKDLSFRVEKGQTIAIVGQTGEGKTTLTKLVNRIYDTDSGRILIDGVDIREWDLARLRSQIATIEQDIFLFSKSIEQNITFGLDKRLDRKSVEQVAREAQAHDFIMEFKDGYETVIGERGVTLSGGQRQRLAIARALLTDPRILILDDATSAVDSATEDAIQKALNRVQQGRTTLLITNRLSQIRCADKVLVLQRGELVDQGTHPELLARCELYRRIFAHYEEMHEHEYAGKVKEEQMKWDLSSRD